MKTNPKIQPTAADTWDVLCPYCRSPLPPNPHNDGDKWLPIDIRRISAGEVSLDLGSQPVLTLTLDEARQLANKLKSFVEGCVR